MRDSSCDSVSPPYTSGSRRPTTSRLTPLRTGTRTRRTLCGDQLVERAANVAGRHLGRVAALGAEQDERHRAAGGLLVAQERPPGALALGAHRFRRQHLVDEVRRLPGEPERSEQAEGDGAAVRYLAVRPGLEGVGERVPEV